MGILKEIKKVLGLEEAKDEGIFEELEETEKGLTEEETKFKCNKCGKEFNTEKGLKIHKSQIHNKKFECKKCDKEFKSKQGLKIHKGMKH